MCACTCRSEFFTLVGLRCGRRRPSSSGAHAPRVCWLTPRRRWSAQVALVLIGAAGTVAGARALLTSLAASIKEGASKAATLAAFWAVVIVAAKFVLES